MILVASLYLVLNYYYRNELLKSIEMQNRYEEELLIRNVESYARTANSCVNTIILQLNQALSRSDLNAEGYPSMRTATQNKIYNCLLNSFSMFHDVEEARILWNNGVCFDQKKRGNHSMYSGEAMLVEELNRININRRGTWINTFFISSYLDAEGLYCIKPYTEIESGQEKGYVILRVKKLSNFTEDDSSGRKFYLFCEEGMLLQTNDEVVREQIQTNGEYEEYLEKCQILDSQLPEERVNKIIRSETVLDNGWRIVVITSLESVLYTLDKTVLVLFGVCAVILIIMFALVGQSAARAVRPIRQLSEHMLSSQDELPDVFASLHRDDEIGGLIDSYNHMIQTNKELISQILEGAQREKKLELSLLQAQIKPHFLYNTLDTVYCLNAVGRYSEASTVVKLLSEYYRLALNRGMERVALPDELNMVRILSGNTDCSI